MLYPSKSSGLRLVPFCFARSTVNAMPRRPHASPVLLTVRFRFSRRNRIRRSSMASTALRCASRRSFDCAENETGFDEEELAEKKRALKQQMVIDFTDE